MSLQGKGNTKRVKSSPYLKGRRMRVFAGPNGSGKSTIFNQIEKEFDLGSYINPDNIEQVLRSQGRIDLGSFGLDLTSKKVNRFVAQHSIREKAKKEGFEIQIAFEDNSIITRSSNIQSYEASLISDLIRNELIKSGKKLTFETVMSHPSKLEVFDLAMKYQYKNYLYFICTESPTINIARVRQRVLQGGHHVSKRHIEERYERSLSLLHEAVKRTYRAFIWDNSRKQPELILEVFMGHEYKMRSNETPIWVNKYLLSR
jgi:predicted ABC-type ATPase